MRIFEDRADGGRSLAKRLLPYKGAAVVVYGLPRGGVPTAKIVADELGAPLDLILTRKIGHPGNPEYAVGAVAEDGSQAMNEREVSYLRQDWLKEEIAAQLQEAKRRRDVYLAGRASPPVKGKIAIVVDDGIATGYTMKAAILSLRKREPARIVVATPVMPESAKYQFEALADEVVAVETPEIFSSIGEWYDDFSQVEDADVLELLKEKTPK